ILEGYGDGDRLLILGGDGRLSKSLTDWPSQLPFAYYPTGSGNDFAKSMKIREIDTVLTALLTEKTQSICVLKTSFGIIVNSMDAGFAAQVIARSESSKLKNWLKRVKVGKLTYLIMAIRSLLDAQSLTVDAIIDGKEQQLKNLFFLSLANNTYFGGGIMIWPEASAHEQKIDLVYIENGPIHRRVLALLDLVLKRHKKSKYIKHIQCQTISIKTSQQILFQTDGEMLAGTEFALTCQERKIYL
ncbi:TPA: diacylglycerol kinase family protein, partial [Streptococcus suis]